MNVLVYSGPGATTENVKHCIETLKLHLSPYYAVVSISEAALLRDPWQHKASLLVIPGGADLPYCNSLNGEGNRKITQFVKKGGKYMGICAGAYYSSARCEFEQGTPLEVSGSRELGFFPGTVKGCAFKGFVYESHKGARASMLSVNNELLPELPKTVYTYYNGGGVFVDAKKHRNVEVLATYAEDVDVDDEDKAAVVYCKVGKGDVLLSGPHPEFTPALMKNNEGDPKFANVISVVGKNDRNRKQFMVSCLKKLGLRVNDNIDVTVPKITPLFLCAHADPGAINEVMIKIAENNDLHNGSTLEDENDTFVFHREDEDDHDYFFTENDDIEDPDTVAKHVKVFTLGALPTVKSTPYFNLAAYYGHLTRLYKGNFGQFGRITGYGEVVSSTSTLMDKNPRFLSLLPTGTVLTATTQVAGRGRGGNVWINPHGVLAASVLFKIPANTPSNVVTLQYLGGLAFVESIFGYGSEEPGQAVGYEDMPVKIKWPNDLYILKPEYFNKISDKDETHSTVEGDDQKWAKVSGAIINSQFIDGNYHLVWGGGINVSNAAPTTSLNLVLEKLNKIRASQGKPALAPIEPEILLAKLMYTMNSYFGVFLKTGMSPFLPLYYKRWFHSDQRVVVDEGNGNPRTCVIKGITPDYGLLIAEDTRNHEILHLQPDGNSFDIFKGLVYRK
ncbi:class II aaRS and biotin synthetase [Suhomyces tanzawaensis NRRL Y-17324]|uniref:Class II aaRS and biotin synthetase n=1 Tax=Suhomyces tanzawaensis NRRL Y-17324 TaxID=984487 RepID=A0A1E4SJ78_9ASCO|nr:class II aaRS and biotin synthetase [Suhomyces tanzawaensis NRRL Y-17324]ODV79548.1 class II aaRS and biotin synthetase [Suhomyces tanzawaensis NRRL Y-17324]